jgi:hypothetical protein
MFGVLPLLSEPPRTPEEGKKGVGEKTSSAKDSSSPQSTPRSRKRPGQKADGAEKTDVGKDNGASVLAPQSTPRSRRRPGQKGDTTLKSILREVAGATVLTTEALASKQPPVESSSSPREEAVPAENQKDPQTGSGDVDSRE